jgi:protease I
MQKPLLGEKIAVLVANGFSEQDLTQAQKILRNAGADLRIVSMDNGLVNSWADNGWGLNFAADASLSEALAVDYTMLLVPGGQRSVEKLKLTAHTRRFINGFLNSRKPTVMFGEAVDLLVFTEKAPEFEVSAADSVKDNLVQAGARWNDAASTTDGMLLTGRSDDATREMFCKEVAGFLIGAVEEQKQVAAQAVAA